MSDQHLGAGKVDEAEETLDVKFPSGDKAAEVVQPRKEPLDSPAPAVAAQFAAVLTTAPIAPIGRTAGKSFLKVAIRNLYWTKRIAAFIVGGLIQLAV